MRIFSLWLVLLLITSCTPKKENVLKDQDLMNQDLTLDDSTGTGLTMKRTDQDELEDGESESQNAEELNEEFTGPVHLQRVKSRGYILPDSLLIGRQTDPLSTDLAERETDYIIRDFLNNFKMGRVARELLSLEAHPLFLEELALYQDVGLEITDFYMGSFRVYGDQSQLRVALFFGATYLEGVMYLKKENGLWSLQDWEIPFKNWPGEPVPLEGDEVQIGTVY
jgi:hypothetical protein